MVAALGAFLGVHGPEPGELHTPSLERWRSSRVPGFAPARLEHSCSGVRISRAMAEGTDHAARFRYRGHEAAQYEGRRASERKWKLEQAAVEELWKTVAPGAVVLDVPVGTGRFVYLYRRSSVRAIGADVSRDMLREARKKLLPGDRLELLESSIEFLPLRERSVDVVVCVRLLNWLPESLMKAAVLELSRVSRDRLLLHVRCAEPLRPLEGMGYHLLRALRSLGRSAQRLRVPMGGAFRRVGRFLEERLEGFPEVRVRSRADWHAHSHSLLMKFFRANRLQPVGICEVDRVIELGTRQKQVLYFFLLETPKGAG